jgi:iron complex transport system substrate-binding protein
MMAVPHRIVSLLPSSTEICFALGLGDLVVGVSHECDFPLEVRGRPILTAPKIDPSVSSAEIDRQVRALVADGLSVYRIDEQRLQDLRPELVVTQDACEVCAVSFEEVWEATRRLIGADVEVLSLSPLTVDDVLDDIVRVGRATKTETTARELIAGLRARLESLRQETSSLPKPRVLVLEWLDPPMIAGHWTPELIRIAGGDPILGHDGTPTGPVGWDRIIDAEPEAILVIPCGFRVAQSLAEMGRLMERPGVAELPAVRAGRVSIVDGNSFFSRPGPRLVDSAEIAALAIHPEQFGRFEVGNDVLVRWPA